MRANGAELLGIGLFTADAGARVKADLSLPFPVCPDPEGTVVNRYSGAVSGNMTMAREATYVVDQTRHVTFERVVVTGVQPATMSEVLDQLARQVAPP
jgi:peroxiredoxin